MSERAATALVGCQVDGCAEEVSYPLSMLRWWHDEPICEECFAQVLMPAEDHPGWSSLDPITLDQLRAT